MEILNIYECCTIFSGNNKDMINTQLFGLKK